MPFQFVCKQNAFDCIVCQCECAFVFAIIFIWKKFVLQSTIAKNVKIQFIQTMAYKIQLFSQFIAFVYRENSKYLLIVFEKLYAFVVVFLNFIQA